MIQNRGYLVELKYSPTRKGKSAEFWARGYFVSTVGLDEEMVLNYIRHQEQEDEHRDQLKMGI